MRKERVFVVLSVVLMIVFVVLLVRQNFQSPKTAAEVYSSVSKSIKTDKLKEKKKSELKNTFGLSADDFDSFEFYATDSVMEVEKILVLKVKDMSQTEDVVNTLSNWAEDQIQLFAGYAEEQAELLKDYVLESRGGIIFFAVTDDSGAAISAFQSAV